jgi:hypothetical protein
LQGLKMVKVLSKKMLFFIALHKNWITNNKNYLLIYVGYFIEGFMFCSSN